MAACEIISTHRFCISFNLFRCGFALTNPIQLRRDTRGGCKRGAKMSRNLAPALSLAAAISLGGCGLYVPEMQEWYEPPENQKITENTIINHIKCELHKGTEAALDKYRVPAKRVGNDVDWFKSWLATVTLKLSVEEGSSLNPGVSWVRSLSDLTSFSLSGGVSGSSEATRTETIAFTYPLSGLLARGKITKPCEDAGTPLIMGDLKIGQFIDKKIFLTTVPGTVIGPYSAFSYEVSFVVVYGGSVTPRWNLIDVTVNPGAPLTAAARSRKHAVTITFAAPNDVAAAEAKALHNAALIGQAVAAALRRNER